MIAKIKRRIYLKAALLIAAFSVVVALIVTAISFNHNLHHITETNEKLTIQLGKGVEKLAARAIVIDDDTFALEIVDGLVENDLVAGATIENDNNLTVRKGEFTAINPIEIRLQHPQFTEQWVGNLLIYPNQTYIQSNAQRVSLENALIISLVCLLMTIVVGLFVRRLITIPLEKVSKAFTKQITISPDKLSHIDIGYYHKDEIGQLIFGINQLAKKVKQQFTDEQQLRQHHQKLQRHFKLIFEKARAGIGLLDYQNKLITHNPIFNQLCPNINDIVDFTMLFEESKTLQRELTKLRYNEDKDQLEFDLTYVQGNEVRHLHCLFACIEGERSYEREMETRLVEVIAYDITQRVKRESEMLFEANHDPLTGIFNRRAGERVITELLELYSENTALFMIDLDKFKPINDIYGHDAGDIVLKHCASQLNKACQQINECVVIRWGGDEFVVAFNCLGFSEAQISDLANTCVEHISTPVQIKLDQSVQVGASVGIVSGSECTPSLEDMLTQADEKMYAIKVNKSTCRTVTAH